MKYTEELVQSLHEITQVLEDGIIPFWMEHGIDHQFGGYLVCFDENGKLREDTDKMIVTQTRMIWGFSHFYLRYHDAHFLETARQGVEFFIRHFWDQECGGWYWKTARDGSVLDNGKVVYGQTFAIYALSEYTLASGDEIGLEYACKTFDLLQKYCADTVHGGYYENMERDWTHSASGSAAGDLKSLDVHMHALEAFTTLYECSKQEIHARKLQELADLILDKMVDGEVGCGYNQFDAAFHRRPAINIRRTWNAERETGEVLEKSQDSTSYGHNVELVWLLDRTAEVLGLPVDHYNSICHKLVDHTLLYGFDKKRGGVYRDGPHTGEPYVHDKEWWQNCEVLVGFLDAYKHFNDERYLEAFLKTWQFDNTYMINHQTGEWRQLLTQDGRPIIANMGGQWKCIYHTGRAMDECKMRLQDLLKMRT